MTTTRRALASIAVGAALLATAVAAEPVASDDFNVADPNSKDSDFRKCFCWDSAKGAFCGGPATGPNNFFNADACQRWSATSSWSMAPIILLGIFFILYPIIFALSRLVCNCCGGRKPSFDCCFSSADAVKNFPGYTRATVWFTRIVFIICFASTVSLSVHTYVASHSFKDSAFSMMDTVNGAITTISWKVGTATSSAESLHNDGNAPSFVSFAEVEAIKSTSNTVDTVRSDVGNAVHDMKTGGKPSGADASRANSDRAAPFEALADVAVSLPLAFATIALVMMIFKVTGLPVTIVSCLFSLAASVLTFVFMVVLVLSISTRTVCRNYDATAVPAALGGLEISGVCNASALQVAAVSAMESVSAYIQDPTSDICKVVASKAVAYEVNTCDGKSLKPADALQAFVQMASYDAAPTNVSAFSWNFVRPAQQVAEAAGSVADCQEAKSYLDNSIAHALCGDSTGLSDTLTVLAVQLGAMMGLSVLTLFIMVRGIKRFGNMKPKNNTAVEGTLENGEYVSADNAAAYQAVYYPAAAAPDTAAPAASNYGSVSATDAAPVKAQSPVFAVVQTDSEANLQQPLNQGQCQV